MTEFLGEFDAASPAPKSFCARITPAQFDQQSSFNTEKALQELLDYLEYNPTAFYNIIIKRKDEENSSGFLSYIKTRLFSWFYNEDPDEFNVTEAKEKLRMMKEEIIKSYNYGQEAKGSVRRFSHRLAQKKWRKVGDERGTAHKMSSSVTPNYKSDKTSRSNKTKVIFPVPPVAQQNDAIIQAARTERVSNLCYVNPPPPPPPPPPVPLPPLILPKLPVTHKEEQNCEQENGSSISLNPVSTRDICQQRKLLKPACKKKQKENSRGDDFTEIMRYIKKPNARQMLRPIQTRGDEEYDTPAQVYRKRKATEKSTDSYNMFNEKLITKFKNAQGSPAVDSPRSDTGFTP